MAGVLSYGADAWGRPPNPRNLYEKYGEREVAEIKRRLLSTYIVAFEENIDKSETKIMQFMISLYCFGTAAVWGISATLLGWL